MRYDWVFTVNNIYNCGQIRRVRWWNKLIGFPGETIVAICNTGFMDEKESHEYARKQFEKMGHNPHVMGMRSE